ncbi:hypothetical protein GCM10022384_59590 [Streptomyces marokkonensis]|uniref:Uncharacterized protein n=1 Tax=Streptomyces marokkonensis TaxID=324855 RepID=A0ABP7S1M0_9ACTN
MLEHGVQNVDAAAGGADDRCVVALLFRPLSYAGTNRITRVELFVVKSRTGRIRPACPPCRHVSIGVRQRTNLTNGPVITGDLPGEPEVHGALSLAQPTGYDHLAIDLVLRFLTCGRPDDRHPSSSDPTV